MLSPSPRLHPLIRASVYYVAVIFGSQLVVGVLLGVAVIGISLIGVTGWQGEVLEGRLPAWLLALSTWMELGVLALATWGFLRFLDRAGWRTLRMVRTHWIASALSGVALVNIALAGVAFALAMRISDSLWLPTAFHFVWNYLLGPVVGLPVSGLTEFSAGAVAQVSGPPLWTGGAFGPEGGLAATLAMIVVCLVLQVFHHTRRARGERLANP